MKPKSSPHSKARPAMARPGSARDGHGPSQRQLRVGEEIRHILAEILLRTEFHDPELSRAHLTISEVRTSPDLKHATVFLTRLGNQDVTPLLPALHRVAPFLRSQIAPKIGLRVVPDLKFLPDAALDEATKINQLLHAPEVLRDLEK
jgi:ribosome-binding factor A